MDNNSMNQSTPTSNNTELRDKISKLFYEATTMARSPSDYMVDETLALIKKETDKARVSGFSVGDTVINTSGWGVGSQTKIPLTIKTILLRVGWENAKSTRYLKSTDVELASINIIKGDK